MTQAINKRTKAYDAAIIAVFAALIAVCSWISVPASVPFTMQTFGVFLAVGVLSGKRGTLAVLVYLLLGTAGAPVFSGFRGGISVLFGSTGGYIIGFLIAALVMWAAESLFKDKKWVLPTSTAAGLLLCYAFGTAWFTVVYTRDSGAIGLWSVLMSCVIPYILPDTAKIILALTLSKRLKKIYRLGNTIKAGIQLLNRN